MKAKEYADRIVASQKDADVIMDVAFDIVYESKDLIRVRKAQTNGAIYAIFNELDDKWQSIVKHANLPDTVTDIFAQLVRLKLPTIYRDWTHSFPHRAVKRELKPREAAPTQAL